jgi:hypothetical protein
MRSSNAVLERCEMAAQHRRTAERVRALEEKIEVEPTR